MKNEYWLLKKFRELPEKPALIKNNYTYTYKDLREGCLHWLDTFDQCKIDTGQCVAFKGHYSAETCMLVIALLVNKNIVIPLGADNKDIEKDLNQSYADHFFDFTNEHNYRYYRRKHIQTHSLIEQLRNKKEAGLILFTSGSTGKPKVVLHSFDRLIAKYKKPRKAYRVLIFLLFNHIGGINTLFRMLASGSVIVINENMKPESICKAIEKYNIELLPATPSFLRMLLISDCYTRFDLSSLRVISYGTEVMPEATLHKLREIFPGVALKQTYGLSELGIFGIKSRDSDSLWVKLNNEHIKTKIVDRKLWVKSDEVMLGYLNAPSPFNKQGWFDTGDYVQQDGEYIKIKGRMSDVINVGGQKVHPSEVEDVLMLLDNVCEVIVFGKSNPVLGNIVAAKIKLAKDEDKALFKKRMKRFCHNKLESYKIPMIIQFIDEVPYSKRFKKMRK